MQKTLLYIWLDLWLRATLGVLSLAAAAADAPTAHTGAQSSATAKCQEALVNPVSGFAECIKPRGAPVAPPPTRPDAVQSASRVDADKVRSSRADQPIRSAAGAARRPAC
jgi:hypothetical protein